MPSLPFKSRSSCLVIAARIQVLPSPPFTRAMHTIRHSKFSSFCPQLRDALIQTNSILCNNTFCKIGNVAQGKLTLSPLHVSALCHRFMSSLHVPVSVFHCVLPPHVPPLCSRVMSLLHIMFIMQRGHCHTPALCSCWRSLFHAPTSRPRIRSH